MSSVTLRALLATGQAETAPASNQIQVGEPISVLAVPDNMIMDLIYESHVHADASFDDESLYLVVENILKHATQVVDKVVQAETAPASNQIQVGEPISVLAVPDNMIMDLIYESHVHADASFDDESLYLVVENILKHATQVVDKVVQYLELRRENLLNA
ncbi:Sieve element occlusion, N-terminal [Parasponia andersonii]|uniref:Sieve element occlusion, N-terminal n=1 Tax=Parasponia andersonii TaxID=3476 RepID=A0A2P5AUB3_PARAD|nr:Sieve element occlusion, N-terminal [Parasponia andersonii]